MFKIKKNTGFFSRFNWENKINFIIMSDFDKNIFSKYGCINHISTFKNFFDVNFKGNFFILFFNRLDFFKICELILEHKTPIFYFSFNKLFVNYLNLLKVRYNLHNYSVIFCCNFIFILINVLNLLYVFMQDLLILCKNIINN